MRVDIHSTQLGLFFPDAGKPKKIWVWQYFIALMLQATRRPAEKKQKTIHSFTDRSFSEEEQAEFERRLADIFISCNMSFPDVEDHRFNPAVGDTVPWKTIQFCGCRYNFCENDKILSRTI